MDTNDQQVADLSSGEQTESTEVVEVQPETKPEAPTKSEREIELEKTVADLTGKLKRATKKDSPTSSEKKQQDALDYGAKAYLRSEGIEPTEFGWVEEQMEESGIRDIEKLLTNGYFKSNLQARRDQQSIDNATPGKTRQSGESAKTKPEYWADKGEMPPNTPDNFELRQKVLNLRIEREKGTGGYQFSQDPVVLG